MTEFYSEIQHWVEQGAFRYLDVAFTKFISEHSDTPLSEPCQLVILLVSYQTAHGDICLDLAGLQDSLYRSKLPQPVVERVRSYMGKLSPTELCEQLVSSSAISDCINDMQRPCDGVNTPLVLGGNASKPLLYLRRYWDYERRVDQGISIRLNQPHKIDSDLSKLLNELFDSADNSGETDWQKVACALAVKNQFNIVTGGPGTGKTTTVIKILIALQGRRLMRNESPLKIMLCAPTGKAAARLSESIAQSFGKLNLDAQRLENIPQDVSTVHRLLGTRPNSRHYKHHAGNPLSADVVVVDEASMVDLELMANLIDALRPDASLILVGDKDQLASVEAGSVLGDLCYGVDSGNYDVSTLSYLEEVTGQRIDKTFSLTSDHQLDDLHRKLCQSTAKLRKCFRTEGVGILALAQWINDQKILSSNLDGLFSFFESYASSLELVRIPKVTPYQYRWDALEHLVVGGYRNYLNWFNELSAKQSDDLNDWAVQLFNLHKEFQLLCAVREGEFGVERLNEFIQHSLEKHRLLDCGQKQWYQGRPVLVTRNDYTLGLMNGDVGICVKMVDDNQYRVAFPDGKGGARWISPSRLHNVQTVFAMTVHKSQGSEFTHTALVLPNVNSAVLTKELFYTAITRSKQHFSLVYSDDDVLRHILTQRVTRQSGLV